MKTSEVLYGAAEYIRANGFSPEIGEHGHPRCFLGSIVSIVGVGHHPYPISAERALDEVGVPYSARSLRAYGWQRDDAIAALEIAADISAAKGD